MKKFLSLSLALMMALGLAACGSDPAPEKEEENQTFFDFDTFTVELKDVELLADDYGEDSVLLTLTYSNHDPDESGRLDDYVSCTATQSGEELSLGNFSEYWADEPYYVHENESADFHIGFRLQFEDDQVYYDMSKIELTMEDKNFDLSYTCTVDLSELDASGLENSGSTDIGEGETESFGDFEEILIPAEFTLKHDGLDEDNPHYISVASDDWAYFTFRNFTEKDEMESDYDYEKENYTDGQTDVSANYGGIDWTGFQYDDGYGGDCFEVYATIDGNYLRVSSAGFTFDDPTTQAILGSVVMAQ